MKIVIYKIQPIDSATLSSVTFPKSKKKKKKKKKS